ncbi:hypothetical protein BH10PSE12_BH10PSE12_25540 [soil metagenome]
MTDDNQIDLTKLTVELLSAYLANNTIPSVELAGLIASTRAALAGTTSGVSGSAPAEEFVPAVSIRKSLSSKDTITSLIDGKSYKTLKRHLSSNGLTPDEYRARYGLPASYPMVAPTYSDRRREVAAQNGLGRSRSQAPAIVETQDATPVSAPAEPVTAAAKPVKSASAKAAPVKAAKATRAKTEAGIVAAPEAKTRRVKADTPAAPKATRGKVVKASIVAPETDAVSAPVDASAPAKSRRKLKIVVDDAVKPAGIAKLAKASAGVAPKTARGPKPASLKASQTPPVGASAKWDEKITV